MLPYFTEQFGNPSSLHADGVAARDAVDRARARIASIIGARPDEIVFTSGGTESNNLAIKGIAYANVKKGKHLIVSAIEHDCVINSCKWLETQGFEVTYLPVNRTGLVGLSELEAAMRKDTVLVSIMHGNNEIGTVQPIEEMGKLCREREVYFHTDACQSFGKLRIDVQRQKLDLITINAHKIHGPKGVGALFVRGGTTISPWQHGGGHEFGIRSSTENVPGIVGFGKAAELCSSGLEEESARLCRLRDRIIDGVSEKVAYAYLNGHRTKRLPNNVNFGFSGFEGEAIKLMLQLDEADISVSTGSACSSNQGESRPSHVLTAIGLNPVEARGALRVTLGKYNTEEEVDIFLQALPKAMESLRSISSLH
jgi:cysteine desulfurase